MTKDNEDALRCAIGLEVHPFREVSEDEKRAAAHLRRLVQENEELRRDLMAVQRENKDKHALLRQALEALESTRRMSVAAKPYEEVTAPKTLKAIVAIRQHLESKQ